MNDAEFWGIIGLLNWSKTGDDEAVLDPAVEALAQLSVAEIEAFEDTLAAKLHALDTKAHAREIGMGAYEDANGYVSVDQFLYARCCVVANGSGFFSTVLANPKAMPKDTEFEALIWLAPRAYERRTGQTFDYDPKVSYETFQNEAGWREA